MREYGVDMVLGGPRSNLPEMGVFLMALGDGKTLEKLISTQVGADSFGHKMFRDLWETVFAHVLSYNYKNNARYFNFKLDRRLHFSSWQVIIYGYHNPCDFYEDMYF